MSDYELFLQIEKKLNPEILVINKETGWFKRAELIPYIRFVYKNVLNNDSTIRFHRLGKYMNDIKAFTGTNDHADPELNEVISEYDRFSIIKNTLEGEQELEFTLVKEGLLLKRGIGKTELINKVIDYKGSWGKYSLTRE
jgi:hypothetical protein